MPHNAALPTYSASALATMGPTQLVAALVRDEDRAPRELIEECARRGDAMLDRLGPLVDDDKSWDDLSTGEWWLRIHEAMILGLVPSARAGALLVAFMHRMGDEGDTDFQDWLAGCWPALFRNKPAELLPALRELADDDTHDWYLRCQAVESVLGFERVNAPERLDAATDWAAAIAGNEEEDWDMRSVTGGMLLDHIPERHRGLLEELGRRQSGTALAAFVLDDVTRAYETGEPETDNRFADPWTRLYSPDAIAKRQERWAKEAAEDAHRVEHEGATSLYDEGGSGDAERYVSSADDDPFALNVPVRTAPPTGRNDPCPCGSGKKYKKCCLAKESAVPTDDLAWRRLRQVLDEHRAGLLRFERRAYGDSAIEEAWQEFSGGELGTFDAEGPHAHAFVPWFCNFWSPTQGRTLVGDATLHGVPPTVAYLKRAKRVDPLFREYLESCLISPFTAFEVVRTTPGTGLHLRDVFTGAEHEASERTGSRTFRAGDLAIGQLGAAGGVTIVEALSGFVISPIHKLAVLDARQLLFRDADPDATVLRARHLDIVALYRRVAQAVLHSQMPAMRNTDGEPLSFRRVVFDVPSAQEAFDALKHLGLGDDDAELLRKTERDATGTTHAVRFPWLKASLSPAGATGNTVLGELEIRGQRLIVHVNSEAREARIRAIVAESMGDRARYRLTEIESIEHAWADPRGGGEPRAARERMARETERLASMPEVVRAVMEVIARQYEKWPDERLPALDGRTPREAVRDATGREAVAAIIAEIERNGARQKPPLDPAIVRRMREQLGLAGPPIVIR